MAQTTINDRRVEAPLGLVLEAGTEIAALGAAAILLYLISPIAIGQGGLIFWSGIYLIIGISVLRGLRQHLPHSHFGLANAITLLRAVFSSFLFALSADVLSGHNPLSNPFTQWLVTILAAVSLSLDGVDGWIARHSGMQSRFGAQFDMHSDALFVLSLTLLLSVTGLAGPWVLLSGLMFYMFLGAGLVWPWLNAALPPRWRRKTICVLQTVMLIVALSPVTPYWAAQLACLAGLGLLTWSFGVDVIWLMRHERSEKQRKEKPYADQQQEERERDLQLAAGQAVSEPCTERRGENAGGYDGGRTDQAEITERSSGEIWRIPARPNESDERRDRQEGAEA